MDLIYQEDWIKLQVLDVKINKMVLNKISSNKFLIIKSAVLKKK